MVTGWRLVYSKAAQKDAQKLAASGLRRKAQELLDVMLRVAQPLALEIAAAAIPKAAEDRAPAPES